MTDSRRLSSLHAALFVLLTLALGCVAHAQSSASVPPADDTGEGSDTALAKKLQNPIGDLYSFPFQNNTNFNVGPHKGVQDILNIQPVIPIHITEDWTIIT